MKNFLNIFDRKRLPGINPVGYGYEKCVSGFSVAVPRPYWMLHFVISGKGTVTNEKGTFTVMPTQMFVVRPHRVHCYKADSEDPWEYMWVNFDGDFPIPALLEEDVITIPSAAKIFSDIIAVDKNAAGAEEYICGKIWGLMSLIIGLEHTNNVKTNPYVDAAKAFIQSNYASAIKVSDIAKHLNLDRSYFSTVFRSETGVSPKQYLANVRLEKAAELLMANCSVSETASRTGYIDHVNFSRMFKKRYGISPMRYKEKIVLAENEFKAHRNVSE